MQLPEICVLTELPLPEMWFNIGRADLCFHFRLDTRARQLLVRCSHLVNKPPDSKVWRITEDETLQIETAVVLGPDLDEG
jgi:hypothetical protein